MPPTDTTVPSALFKRSFVKSFPQAVRGEGVRIWDAEGNSYVDFSGSAAVNFIGHGVSDVGAAMARQVNNLEFVHSSQFTTSIAEEFAQEVLGFAGDAFRGGAVYFTCGGSEAVETALKLARQYQVEIGQAQRYHVVGRVQGYHGSTLGALAVSGNRLRREMYLPMVRTFEQATVPYCYRCHYGCTNCGHEYAAEVDRALEAAGTEAAAFIFEPMSGATLGASVPPADYLALTSEICARRGVVTIADEVMTGFGRTGKNFAIEHWNLIPDILVTAKGIASGYAPLGAVIASKKVADAIAKGSGGFVHGFTYNAHPVALAAGRAVMRQMRDKNLVARANSEHGEAGRHVKAGLQRLLDCTTVGDVRGLGLLWGVEFVVDKKTKQPYPADCKFSARVGAAAARRGVMVYPMQGCVDGITGDHLLIAPPAIISPAEITWSVDRLVQAIQEVEQALQKK